jgi:gamma-glutamyltranspeptidase/glutathione hydrolase/leukotriene-C4 hydrolase
VISNALSLQVGDSVVYGPGAPASGAVLISVFNALQHFSMGGADLDTPVAAQRVVEAFKWAYAARSRLGDPADKDISDDVKRVRISELAQIVLLWRTMRYRFPAWSIERIKLKSPNENRNWRFN